MRMLFLNIHTEEFIGASRSLLLLLLLLEWLYVCRRLVMVV